MSGISPEQGSSLEASQAPITLPTQRGTDRFPWKSMLLTLGLSLGSGIAGNFLGEHLFNPAGSDLVTQLIRANWVAGSAGLGAVLGFESGLILVGGFNVFRENVVDFSGRGQLHPKSPALQV